MVSLLVLELWYWEPVRRCCLTQPKKKARQLLSKSLSKKDIKILKLSQKCEFPSKPHQPQCLEIWAHCWGEKHNYSWDPYAPGLSLPLLNVVPGMCLDHLWSDKLSLRYREGGTNLGLNSYKELGTGGLNIGQLTRNEPNKWLVPFFLRA